MPIRRFICRWKDCRQTYEDVEVLFDHLSDDHVGRRSTNNLCLTCAWNDCGATAAKRDHLTSHLKIHLPFKPYFCLICRKSFKRPQDLKKHERIHTIEHQASLLSNQPGYKPVRRRRILTKRSTGTNRIKNTNSTTIGLPALPTPSVSQPYSDVSGRVINDNSIVGTTRIDILDIHGGNTNDIDRVSTINTALHGYKNCSNDNDPLGDFLQHVLKDDCPPPGYDIHMMQRLNSLSYLMQQNKDDFILPVSKPDEISALQTWLEQLSANIQTKSDIYPDSMASTQQHNDYSNLTTILVTDTATDSNIELSQCNNMDRPLYPSCGGAFDISNNASSVNTYKTSSLAASSLSPSTYTNTPRNLSSPAATNTLLTTTTTPNTSNDNQPEISPLFWKPGPTGSTTSTVELPVINGPAPSEEIDFSPAYLHHHQQQQRQPAIHFETKRNDVEHVAVPINKVDTSFDSKQEIMQMINVFASPTQNDTSGKVDSDTVCDNLINDNSTNSPDLETAPTTEKPPLLTVNIPASVMMMTLPSPTTANTDLSETGTSPYADLVDQLRSISLQNNNVDDDDEVDGKLRERHAQVVDLLWRATLRKTLPSPLLSRTSTHTVPI